MGLSIMGLSIMTFGLITLSIMIFSIITLSIKTNHQNALRIIRIGPKVCFGKKETLFSFVI
jgi:hypothetical protein